MDKKDKMEVTYEDGLTRISEQELGNETFMKAQNAISDGDYKTAIKATEEELQKATAPMPLDKATNLSIVE